MRSPSVHEPPPDGRRLSGRRLPVVGTDADAVTTLRVGDVDGRRTHTEDPVTVPREALDGFEAATDPGARRSLPAALASAPATVSRSLRAFGR
jgi:hypothetical protein